MNGTSLRASVVPVIERAPGNSTASSLNVRYRIGRIAPYVSGRWLDYGCADGGYAAELLRSGAAEVIGVDVEADRVNSAEQANINGATFSVYDGKRLPFSDHEFDGALVNEVLEHVEDELVALREIKRVLKPGGYVAVISPNRWFPIDGHTLHVGSRKLSPAPLVPWLPSRLTRRHMNAANYWPRQLTKHVQQSGFAILDTGYIWPVMEIYPWLPAWLAKPYQRHIRQIDQIAGLRRFGVSTLVVGVKPAKDAAPVFRHRV